jgi:hypothetical protein
MRKIIITDLTRFQNKDIVCTAGIDINDGKGIRPMPYLQYSDCKRLNLLPGAILSGNFSVSTNIECPHTEDMYHESLKFHGHCSDHEFRDILLKSCSKNIEHGFNIQLGKGQKHIPKQFAPSKSIITISVNPNAVKIVQDQYDAKKIKIHFVDNNFKEYSFLAITDLGFHSYAENHYKETNNYDEINSVIQNQEEVFLRVGLGRFYENQQGKSGFWIQVNGIYSFPDYFKSARRYE